MATCTSVLSVVLAAVTVNVYSHSDVTVYYARGGANMELRTGHYELGAATFTNNGSLTSVRNLTDIDIYAMGYVTASPGREGKLVFAAQTKTNGGALTDVELYTMPKSSSPASHLTPAISDYTPLLAPCQDPRAPFNCTDASTFYPHFGETGIMLFSYRAWTVYGNGRGNQALAVQSLDGAVRSLTYNVSDTQGMHTCPRFVPGSNDTLVLFVADAGTKHLLALYSFTDQSSTILNITGVADFAGCPDFLPDVSPPTFFYIADAGDVASPPMMTGVSLVLPADGGTPLPETSPWWPIKLIAFPPSVDVMSLRFCSQVSHGAAQQLRMASSSVISCLTADDNVALVSVGSGAILTNFTPPLLPFQAADPIHHFCITPDCYVIDI